MDTLTDSKTWYLDGCGLMTGSDNRLLLTNYDLGRSVTSNAVQFHLDFGRRDAELFTGTEMGEDVRRVMGKYRRLLGKILERVRAEEPVLREALTWSRQVFSETFRVGQTAAARGTPATPRIPADEPATEA